MNLRSITDENVPRSTARVLRDAGFDAVDVRDVGLRE
jgi:predicted nuclease of predicted toxin-antitoxin system